MHIKWRNASCDARADRQSVGLNCGTSIHWISFGNDGLLLSWQQNIERSGSREEAGLKLAWTRWIIWCVMCRLLLGIKQVVAGLVQACSPKWSDAVPSTRCDSWNAGLVSRGFPIWLPAVVCIWLGNCGHCVWIVPTTEMEGLKSEMIKSEVSWWQFPWAFVDGLGEASLPADCDNFLS